MSAAPARTPAVRAAVGPRPPRSAPAFAAASSRRPETTATDSPVLYTPGRVGGFHAATAASLRTSRRSTAAKAAAVRWCRHPRKPPSGASWGLRTRARCHAAASSGSLIDDFCTGCQPSSQPGGASGRHRDVACPPPHQAKRVVAARPSTTGATPEARPPHRLDEATEPEFRMGASSRDGARRSEGRARRQAPVGRTALGSFCGGSARSRRRRPHTPPGRGATSGRAGGLVRAPRTTLGRVGLLVRAAVPGADSIAARLCQEAAAGFRPDARPMSEASLHPWSLPPAHRVHVRRSSGAQPAIVRRRPTCRGRSPASNP